MQTRILQNVGLLLSLLMASTAWGQPPQNSDSPESVMRFEMENPNANSNGIKSADVTEVEVSSEDQIASAIDGLSQENERIDVATAMTFETEQAEPRGFRAGVRKFFDKVAQKGARVRKQIQTQARKFEGWTDNARGRFTVFKWAITGYVGFKIVEYLIVPLRPELIPVLAAGVLETVLTGVVEWNSQAILGFLTTPPSFLEKAIDRYITNSAAAAVIKNTYKYSAITGFNFVLLQALQFLSSAGSSELNGQTVVARLATSLGKLSPDHWWGYLGSAAVVTVFSYPSTMAIFAYKARRNYLAKGDKALEEQILYNARSYQTLLFTMRVALLSSAAIGSVIHFRPLQWAGWGGLTVLAAGSWIEWIAQTKELNVCKAIAEGPKLPEVSAGEAAAQ